MEIFPASFICKEQNDGRLKYGTLSDLLNIIYIKFKCLITLSTLCWDGNGKGKDVFAFVVAERGRDQILCVSCKLKWKILTCPGVLSCAPQSVRTGAPSHGRAALPFQPTLVL